MFNAKVIGTSASGAMKVYGLPKGQGLDMDLACSSGHIILAVQALAFGT